MNILHAVVLGIVEGITEFLPISSTGHLVLTSRLLGLADSDFLKTFEIAIQAGAVMAVLSDFGARLMRDRQLMQRIAAAFVPTAVVGLLLYPFVKRLLGAPEVVLISMGIGGIFLILFERRYKEPVGSSDDLSRMSYRTAMGIGLAQCLALVPGVSRSATTILSGLALGLSRRAIVEFSFLLAIPTLGAATALELFKNRDLLAGSSLGLLAVGFVVSWAVALASIRWLLGYVRTHDFTAFGIYRIVASIIFFAVLLY